MSPTTRKVARLIGELASVERRLKNLLPEIKEIEFEAQALKNAKQINQPVKPSSTGIYKTNVFGEREEIPQEYIDAWCSICQFPLETPECSKESIQMCWDESGAIAGEWHKQHECPFIHKGIQQKLGYIKGHPEPCRCNEFPTIEDAFKAAGIGYCK